MRRKGDFQMSLGFIIAVVFSIVLLSLALTWLSGLIGGVVGLTDDLTQEAQSTLRDAFRGGTASSFAVWPSQYKLDAGKSLKMSAGIENDAIDGKDHKFVINVRPAIADQNVLLAKCGGGETLCPVLEADLKKWVTFDFGVGTIAINEVGFKFIEIRPPGDAVKGTYIFNVVACYDELGSGTLTSASCTETSTNLWGGSAQQVIISVGLQ
ncbi:MAG: hypothetical protein HY369_02685 [Candidatus Aenigmarchaeota archaeon]|nr:hypothetical protein [Candidatus Aenigmarchaeota archaeon]